MTQHGEGPGFTVAVGPCFVCERPFGFNPARVPSFKGQPLCQSCVEEANAERERDGRPTWEVFEDSYAPMPGWPA